MRVDETINSHAHDASISAGAAGSAFVAVGLTAPGPRAVTGTDTALVEQR